jgi:hypothetical protein
VERAGGVWRSGSGGSGGGEEAREIFEDQGSDAHQACAHYSDVSLDFGPDYHIHIRPYRSGN